MSALGFKARFAGPVERREKRQSIRANAARFEVGRPIQLYTGMRTKACRKLVADDPICLSIEPVVISERMVTVGGRRLVGGELRAFIVADGFDTYRDFLAFFLRPGTAEFFGHLIKWGWP